MPLQRTQVFRALQEDFEPHVDISDLSSHPQQTIDETRRSRALAALAFASRGKIEPDAACAAITDESNDHGLDLVGVSTFEEALYIIQAKTGEGSPGLTDVQKFNSGIRALLAANFDVLGPKVRSRRDEIETAFSMRNLRVFAIFTHLGTKRLDDTVRSEVQMLLQDTNSGGEILEYEFLDLAENHSVRNAGSFGDSINSKLTMASWTTPSSYKDEILGIVRADEIASLVENFGDRLFDKNIRKALKSSEVNQQIIETLTTSPENFWNFNNGITIVVDTISAPGIGRPRANEQVFDLQNLSVVNGAQTSTCIYSASREGSDLSEAYVTVRVISTEGRGEEFGSNVTRFTNTQNRIGGREFVALDPFQQDLKDLLAEEGIQYSFRTGEEKDCDRFHKFINLEDATRALACFAGVEHASRVKSEISTYWNDYRSESYTKLFKPGLEASVVVHTVNVYREIDCILGGLASKTPDGSKVFKQMSNFVTALVLEAMRVAKFEFENIDVDSVGWVRERAGSIERFAQHVFDIYSRINPTGYPLPFFKNITKVKSLLGATGSFFDFED